MKGIVKSIKISVKDGKIKIKILSYTNDIEIFNKKIE